MMRKAITVHTYDDYPKHSTPDNVIIIRMLHLTLDKNKLHNEQRAQSDKEHMAEYKIDNSSVYDQIYKYTDLYPYIKWHKSKIDGRGAFYAIHSRWRGPNYVNVTASEAKLALLMFTHDGEKKAKNWEKYVAQHVK